MKKSIILALSLLVAGSFVFIGCGKYEDGPGMSLRSKKGRLAGDWKVEKATSTTNGTTTDWTSLFAGYVLTIDKDGSFTETMNNISTNGTWKFSDDKMLLIQTYTSSGNVDTMPITRLTNKEFWSKEVNGNTTDEIQFSAM